LDAPVSTHLDGDALSQALVSGIHRVIADSDVLNRINVFPVADGDTGTNLSLSLGAALGVLKDPGEKHLGTMLAALADAMLDGARGNSGAIVAQFFQGVSDSAGELTRFTTYTFSKAVATGNEYAHDALSNPREGTILSVVAASSKNVAHHVRDVREGQFSDMLHASLESMRVALKNTQDQLDVLRKAGVVDAGAKGFVDLFEGVTAYITDGTVEGEPDLSLLHSADVDIAMAGSGEETQFRYCTECIVTGSDINRRKLREALAELGDSVVLAGTKRKAKIHVHANDPKSVFELGGRFGEVSAEKADDLHRQAHSSHDRASSFAVITDSAADIADEDMERLDIHMVPCRVQFGDRGYLDKVSISSGEFFEMLKTNPHHPTTSQPSPGDFRRQFQFLASHFDDVLSINLTGVASGTYEAARSAAERTNARGKVHVIDSRNATLGQGLIAVYAAELAHAGVPIGDAIEKVREIIPKTGSFGVIKDMRYAVRGGRLPGWVQTIAKVLRITPFIRTTPEGSIAKSGFAFGTGNRTRKFAKHMIRQVESMGPIRLAIGHAACPDDARELEALLRDGLPQTVRLTITELGSGLGAHTGPGTLVVAVQPYTNSGDTTE
jgi:DegV family protein with EDD domain